MRIAIASIFRNAESYLERWGYQMSGLCGALQGSGFDVHLILAEGDSTDATWKKLSAWAKVLMLLCNSQSENNNLSLFQASHGGPLYGSIDKVERWRNISFVCNQVLDRVTEEDDYLVYVESDLIWDVDTMQYLLGDLDAHFQIDAIAPMCFRQGTTIQYDTWGHRKGGKRFTPNPPYHPNVHDSLTRLDSAGSCIVMRGEVAKKCRFTPPEQGIVGFCSDMHAKGYLLYLDPHLAVEHP